jgi:hypothetical protein
MMMRRPRRRLREQSINRLIPNMFTVLALCAGLTGHSFRRSISVGRTR